MSDNDNICPFDGRFLAPIVPATYHKGYPECRLEGREWDATVIGADTYALCHDIKDYDSLSPAEQRALPDGDDPPNTHFKHVAQAWHLAHVFTRDEADDPGMRVRMWQVHVDPRFKPDPSMDDWGLVSGIDLRYSNKSKTRKNLYKMYMLFCLSPQLEGISFSPVPEGPAPKYFERETVGWDEELQVDLMFKKIYNAVIDYYNSDRGRHLTTKLVCPLLYRNAETAIKVVEKEGLREVDLAPWLHEDQKYAL